MPTDGLREVQTHSIGSNGEGKSFLFLRDKFSQLGKKCTSDRDSIGNKKGNFVGSDHGSMV